MSGLTRRDVLRLAGGLAAVPFVPERASSQSYPTRPVRVIVAYAPGGVTDVLTRLIVGKVGEQLGRQFYVENIPGGSGNIGMGQAARAAPDGYTLLGAFAALAINPILFEKTPFDPVKDFEPISLAATSTTILVVNPAVPAKSVGELVALIRANPGKYSYSSAGIGTQSHLAGEQFRLSLGLDIVHVPFNGGSPAVAAVVAGHTPIGFATPTAAAPQVEDGKVRGLAVTSKQRSRALPGVATMTETGHGDIEGDSWVGFVAPAGTPKDVVTLLNREIVKAIAQPDTRDKLTALGYDPVGSTPEELGAQIKSDIVTWAKVIRAANIRVQ
jgi:tripartite-type tricarboxylate transporter receptor subunit TctC